MRSTTPFLALGLALLPLAAASATPGFVPPDGCRLDFTVQERSCTAVQHYRCDSDPPGDRRAAYFGEGGVLRYLSRIDRETRWVWSEDPQSGIADMLVDEARDHGSLTTLLATGRDDFDFWTLSNTGERLHHVGHDELTGETQVIDGVELEVTRFELTTSSDTGEVLIRRHGQQFVSRAQRRFYGGVEEGADWTGEVRQSDDTPVLFAFPGEAGFGSVEPQFGCGMLMTGIGDGPGPVPAAARPGGAASHPLRGLPPGYFGQGEGA